MIKWISRKPKVQMRVYPKYGFVNVRHQVCFCPRCWHILNAGPGYQPNYCGECGQRLTFDGMEWKADELLDSTERRGSYEPDQNRVV